MTQETKHCRRCDTTKHRDEFYTRRKGTALTPYCKRCTNNQAVEKQRGFKLLCIEYKGGVCEGCGYSKCAGALEFHHRDPNEKDFTLSGIKKTKLNDEIRNELDKCDLLCANCHREAHWKPMEFINLSRRQPAKVWECKECSAVVSYGRQTCKPCSDKGRERISWPPTDELVKMIEETNYSAVSRVLGVSGNAIRKRLRKRLTTLP